LIGVTVVSFDSTAAVAVRRFSRSEPRRELTHQVPTAAIADTAPLIAPMSAAMSLNLAASRHCVLQSSS
jgi:hypothetical protein